MKQKSKVVANAIEAHGWVGLVISVPLFIVFWAGAITLFFPEVQRWAQMPHYPLTQPQQSSLSTTDVVNDKLAQLNYDYQRQMNVFFPGHRTPYMQLFVPVFDSDKDAQLAAQQRAKKADSTSDDINPNETSTEAEPKPASTEFKRLTIDPTTGRLLSDANQFELASFLNHLHFTLELPQGLYIVGVITFFFLVIVFTGVVIQFKNIFRNFFLYRHKKTLRYRMNDLHNVVGVISLPFGLMYALTGVMFNLSILFQVATMFGLYQGDSTAMLKDAGLGGFQSKPAHVAAPMPNLDQLMEQIEAESNIEVGRIRVLAWGDENAMFQFSGVEDGSFADRVSRVYSVASQDFPADLNGADNNAFADGVDLLFSMHMATFAGVDLRFVYFLLAMGFCAMIIAGNVLWIAKRQKKKNAYSKTIQVTRGLTLGACVAVIPATALGFLLERGLPLSLSARGDWIHWSFGLVLLVGAISAFFVRNNQRFIAYGCLSAAALLLVLTTLDSLIFGPVIWSLWQQGYAEPAGVSFAIALVAAILLFCGRWLLQRDRTKAAVAPQSVDAKSASTLSL